MSIAQDIGGFFFYYGHASSDCTSDYIATSNRTTLQHDECNVVFHGNLLTWYQEFATCDMA
jgi:hypothetical protein